MISVISHPGAVLIVGALLLALLRGRARAAASLGVPLAALYLLWHLPDGVTWRAYFLDYELALVVTDNLSRLFALIFAIMAFGGGLFALNQKSRVELPAAFRPMDIGKDWVLGVHPGEMDVEQVVLHSLER